jgi:hypothetical protein
MSDEQKAQYIKDLKYYKQLVYSRTIPRDNKYYIISRMNYLASEIKEKT